MRVSVVFKINFNQFSGCFKTFKFNFMEHFLNTNHFALQLFVYFPYKTLKM